MKLNALKLTAMGMGAAAALVSLPAHAGKTVDAIKARVEAVTGLSLNNREIGNAIQDAIDLGVADRWPDSRMVEVLSSNVPDNMPGELAREKYLRAQIAKSAGASAPPAREINWKELYEQKCAAYD
ncbi:MAG: hypothetical protein IH617_15970, partial [Hydrogenophaga sp.]|nr:hypothetical protein [Hydrogenophaga sp.]